MPCDPAVRAMCNYQEKHILGFSGLVGKNAFYGTACGSRDSKLPRDPPTAKWRGHEHVHTRRTPCRNENAHTYWLELTVNGKAVNGKVAQSCPTLCDSPWDSPGENTAVGSLSHLQGILPTQGSNPGLPHGRQTLYQLSHKGSPRILECVAYPIYSSSSWPRNPTRVSCIAGGFFTSWAINRVKSARHRRAYTIQYTQQNRENKTLLL